ncbi:ABC transporter substrate-binding protein [Microbacterium terrisoli]|jgi:raffinose/stachyose/melibiose transport system substrate-binding protein|uniref:ABC transporter substrate-binding protein n=1 Tax=Microbacterium terrisoli TaxID=3242192 RepID=UPI002803837B|nr:extracellular solute-binding protein [Microbacterium protaetiae]
MKSKVRGATFVALAAGVALAAAGCSGSTGGNTGADGGTTTLTVWQNSTTGPGQQYWVDAAKAFHEANPKVTVKVQSIQNEQLDGKLQTALNSGNPPDVFLQRGGGKMAAMVKAGQVMDITDSVSADTKQAIGAGALKAESIDGKVYAMPLDVLPEGLFYSKDLFDQAGITSTPTTMDELNSAITALKGKGVIPVAVGAKDAWPAAHWYYNFALRLCSEQTLDQTAKTLDFSDPCWTAAGNELKKFNDSKPFQPGFLTTSAQQGAGSSAGLVANHKAAMELMGGWDPGVIASLTPDQKPLPDLAWFPFPTVAGGQGDPAAIMGGVDGYSCSAKAPKKACTDFLNFLVTQSQQEAYYKAFNSPPVNLEAQKIVTEPYLKDLIAAYNKAPYVSQYLDTLYGQNVGNALNVAVVNLMAGKGSVADIITAVNQAAAKG